MSKSKIFLTLCLGLIGGVFLGRFINYEIMAIAAMIFIITIALGWSNKMAVVIGMTGLMAVLGAWRFQTDIRQNDLTSFYDQKITGTGMILEEPDVRPDKTFLTIGKIMINGKEVDSKILFNVGRFPEYEYGQKVSFTGKLEMPKDAQNPGDFSYKNYLSRYGIDGLIYFPKVEVMGLGGNVIKSQILKFKKTWVENVSQLLPEPQNAFLAGLLLGAKRSIPQWLIDSFNATGTSHIIAVSGYNITIIAAGIDWILRRFLRKRISFILSLIAIIIFVIMTGASASVIRAGMMGALGLVALNLGRIYAITNALALTAAAMLVINPQILHFDVGFQLSFSALLGLVYLTPMIEPYFQWMPKLIQPYWLATLSAQAFALPILLLNFDRLSLIAPIANVLTLPFIPLTMLFGFLSGILSFVWDKLALPLAWITWILLTYIIKVISFLANIPFASLAVNFSIWGLVIYYLVLSLILFQHYKWKPRLKTS